MPKFVRLLMLWGPLSFVFPAPAAAQTVQGTVTNSVTGAGISGVTVDLIRDGEKSYSAATDAQGHFQFDQVQNGSYLANYTSPDFFVMASGGRRLQRYKLTDSGNPVTLEAQMTPLARLSGRVVDGTGKPVPGAEISATGPDSATTLRTDKEGKFELHKFLLPGDYTLSVAPPAGLAPPAAEPDRVLNWTRTYYPGVTLPEEASKLSLLPGAEVSDLVLKLLAVPAHPLRGVLLNPDGSTAAKTAVSLGSDQPQLSTESGPDGSFEFPAVVDGDWNCSAEVQRGGVKLRASQWIEMAGHEQHGLKLRLAAPFTVRGKVVMEARPGAPSPRPPGFTLDLHAASAFREMFGDNGILTAAAPGSPDARPDPAGEFSVPNVYPGAYRVLPHNAPPGYFLDSIRLGDAEVTAPEVEISVPGISLTLVYKTNGGAVRGSVENCASGGIVVVPQDPVLRRPGFLRSMACGGGMAIAGTAPGSSGPYEVDALRPGDYYILAISGGGPTPWYRIRLDDALLSQAAKVTIRPGETSSADLRAFGPDAR